MLDAFIVSNRVAIVARAQARVAVRACPRPSDLELENGIPIFLDQLGEALRTERAGGAVDHQQIGESAGRHGHDLLRMGLSIGQVVHDYGAVCQTITELALEQEAPISGEDFRMLNLCLDDAIAEAVTEYSVQRERAIAAQGTERLGVLAQELGNLLDAALLSFESIKSGRVAPGGSTALVHSRSLMRLRSLIDRSLAAVRLDVGIESLERISVAEFIEEFEIGASIQAEAAGLAFVVTSVDRTVTIEGDRQILAAAVSNLLQNAFKFSHPRGNVALTARATADRVLFEVEDECGGLAPGQPQHLFHSFEQRDANRSGVGLGLSICFRAAKANGGELRVRDIPGKGCIFTLDLPRKLSSDLTGGGRLQ
jgi:signal transduction histidine kinase